ncbi:MAG TPA: DUF1365 domain-containing protein [Dermatophilaceae bacterium]|nr:DUF1365 domain-containing protein [Dermatophilaceae bacterium]
MTRTRLYATRIRHVRRGPVAHTFEHRSHSWLVDLDDLEDHDDHPDRLALGPGLRPLARFVRFEARDHLGRPDRTLRQNVDDFLGARGVELAGGRVLMLAGARVLGVVFNPITVFWCFRREGGREALACVVVEVHNTYGERHAYLVHPDATGRTQVGKELYVSPFNDLSGTYDLLLPQPGERLRLSVTLRRPGHDPFVATLTGRRLPATRSAALRQLLTQPLEPLRVIALIRWHGIRLWLRRLPVQPRPVHQPQEGVQ